MAHTSRPNPRSRLFGIAALAAVAGGALAGPAWGETECYNVSCATACSPAPAAISTLVASADFPAGASTPIAFVDPGDGRGRFLIATQEGAILVWDGATGGVLAARSAASQVDDRLHDPDERHPRAGETRVLDHAGQDRPRQRRAAGPAGDGDRGRRRLGGPRRADHRAGR